MYRIKPFIGGGVAHNSWGQGLILAVKVGHQTVIFGGRGGEYVQGLKLGSHL